MAMTVEKLQELRQRIQEKETEQAIQESKKAEIEGYWNATYGFTSLQEAQQKLIEFQQEENELQLEIERNSTALEALVTSAGI